MGATPGALHPDWSLDGPHWSLDGPPDGPPIVLVHGSRLTRASWRGVIDRLERGGWVRRAADPNDRRKVIVEPVRPSADGAGPERHKDLFRLLTMLQDEIVTALDDYDDDEIARLVEYLERANDAVERSIERLRQRD